MVQTKRTPGPVAPFKYAAMNLSGQWENRLGGLPYLLTGKNNTAVPDPDNLGNFINYGDFTGRSVVDTSLHWAYSLHGYER